MSNDGITGLGIYRDLLGLSDDEMSSLRSAGVI